MNPILPRNTRFFILSAPIWAICPAEAGFEAVKDFFEVVSSDDGPSMTPSPPRRSGCRFEVTQQSGQIAVDEIWADGQGGEYAPVTTVLDPELWYFVRGGDGWFGAVQDPTVQPTSSHALLGVARTYFLPFIEIVERSTRRGWEVSLPDNPFFGKP